MSDVSDVSRSERELVAAADAARADSYAPYSKFEAGAAVLTSDGAIHTGAIVENISLGLAMCAERVAMFSAVTAAGTGGGRRLRALVLAAPDTGRSPTWPCGACRQVALELGGPEVVVAAIGEDGSSGGEVEWRRLGDLMPDAPVRER